jgi:hypothetical protein
MADGLNTVWLDLDCARDGIGPGTPGGVRVLDVSGMPPGAFATTGLAGLGVDGTKAEAPCRGQRCRAGDRGVLRLEIAGAARVRDLLFTGRLLGAAETQQCGLVSRVPQDDMFEACVSHLWNRSCLSRKTFWSQPTGV